MLNIDNQGDDELQMVNQATQLSPNRKSNQLKAQSHTLTSNTPTKVIDYKVNIIIAILLIAILLISHYYTTTKLDTLLTTSNHNKEELRDELKMDFEQQEKQIKALIEEVKDANLKIAHLQQYLVSTRDNNNVEVVYGAQQVKKVQLKYDISQFQNPNKVVEVIYDAGQYAKMPLNIFQTSNGMKIEEVLYPDLATRQRRIYFQQQRKDFLGQHIDKPQLFLAQYNSPLNEVTFLKGIADNQKEWLRLQTKFNFSKIKTELPMCIIVPSYNNNDRFRIQFNLNSIFVQNYTNYRAIIIDDFSNDGTLQTYKKYLQFYRIDKRYYTLISNVKKATAMTNHYFATLLQCSKDSIVLDLDGDDEFIGRNVLQLFNWGYQTKKSGVLYSNFYWYQQPSTLMFGMNSEYGEAEKKKNLYRTAPMQYSHLRSFRAELLHQVDPKDYQDDSGKFYTIAADIALIMPLLELSCGRVNKIQGEYSYLYNMGTGLNDYNNLERQRAVDNQIRNNQKRYECWRQFDGRMKALE